MSLEAAELAGDLKFAHGIGVVDEELGVLRPLLVERTSADGAVDQTDRADDVLGVRGERVDPVAIRRTALENNIPTMTTLAVGPARWLEPGLASPLLVARKMIWPTRSSSDW